MSRERSSKMKSQLFSRAKVEESSFKLTEDKDSIPTQLMELVSNEAPVNTNLKIVFFTICCLILLAITGMLIRVLYVMMTYKLPNNSPEFAVELVSVIGAFIAAFMKVIQTIAENLFTQKIPDSMVNIMTRSKH